MIYTFILPGKFGGKQRQRTLKNGHSYTPYQTVTAENWIRCCVIEQLGRIPNPVRTPVKLHLAITVAIPASWPKSKQLEALCGNLWPTGKPDWDNTGKLISDALNGILWVDDAQVIDGRVTKAYGFDPQAILTVEL